MSNRKAWLHFWRRESAANLREWQAAGRRGPNPLNAIPVPYAADLINPRDRLYVVEVNWPGTRFELLGRIEVRTVGEPPNDPRAMTVVVAKRGTATRCAPVPIPRRVSNKLVLGYADGTHHRVRRRPDGTILGGSYQGRASVRELVGGGSVLETLLRSP